MPRIDDELWPGILPVIRISWKGERFTLSRRSVVALYPDALVHGKPPAPTPPDDAYTPAGSAALAAFLAPHAGVIPIERITSATVRPRRRIGRAARCDFRLETTDGPRRFRAPISTESLLIGALDRTLADRLKILPLRATFGWWVTLVLFALLAGLGILVAIAQRGERAIETIAILAPFSLLAALLAFLLFPRSASLGARRAPSKPLVIRRTPRRSQALGWILRLAGLAAVIAAYYWNQILTARILEQLPGDQVIKIVYGYDIGAVLITLLSAPGFTLLYVGYLLGQPDAATRLRKDPRPPIVFLRSFGDDGRRSFSEKGFLPALLGVTTAPPFDRLPPPFKYIFNMYPIRLVQMVFNVGMGTAEEQIARALRPVGPLVAVGKPNEPFPTPGAARLYTDHDSWQKVVLDLLDSSGLAIIQPARTLGVWWEVKTTLERLPRDRVLVSLCALEDPDDLDIARARLSALLARPLPPLPPGSAFLWFERDGTPRVEPIRRFNPFLWPLKGTSADLRTTLAPALATALARSEGPALPRPKPSKRTAPVLAAVLVWFLGQFFFFSAIGTARMLSGNIDPSLSTRERTVDFGAFSLPINAAWTEQRDPTIRPFVSMKVYALGPFYRLAIASTIDSFGGAPEYARSTADAVAADLAKAGWRDVKVASWSTEDIGDRRWRYVTFTGADVLGRPLLQQTWALGTDTRLIEIVLAGPASGRADIEASARRTVAALSSNEKPRRNYRVPTLVTVRGSRDPYEFLIPDSWTETAAPEVFHADRFFIRRNEEAIVVRLLPDYFRDDSPDDFPRAYDRYLRAEFNAAGVEARDWTPAASTMIQGAEWFHARSVVSADGKDLVRDHWCFRYDRRLYDFVIVGLPDPDEPGLFDRDARRIIESFRIPPPQEDPAPFSGREVPYTISVPRDWAEDATPDSDRLFEYDPLHTFKISITRPAADGLLDTITSNLPALASDPGFARGWTNLRFVSTTTTDLADLTWTTATFVGAMNGADDEMTREHWLLARRNVLYEIVFIHPSSLTPEDPRRASFLKALTSFRPPEQ